MNYINRLKHLNHNEDKIKYEVEPELFTLINNHTNLEEELEAKALDEFYE